MELQSIPGVGEKTAAALAELDDPVRALREGDVATLARAPGLTPGRAAHIARAAIRDRHDEGDRFLATDRAQAVHRALLDRLQARARTTYAEHRLETFYPSAAESRIDEVRTFVADALERDPGKVPDEPFQSLAPLEAAPDVRVRDRCLATADADTYSRARDAVPEISVEVIDDARDLAELARGYSTVIALDQRFAGIDVGAEVDGAIRVEPDALDRPVEVVPERTLGFFAVNRERLRAAIEIHREAGVEPPEGLDIDVLESALERLDPDGGVVGDAELDRLAAAIDDLDTAVELAESVANDRLREAIRDTDVTIEGGDLLSLVEQGASADSILARELREEFEAAVTAAREHLIDALALEGTEADHARRAFPEEPTFPVEHEADAIQRLRAELTATRDRRSSRLKREVAADLADRREPADRLVRAALELDVELAVARFAEDFACQLPEFGGSGFDIVGGRCPLLEEPFEAIEPVDYRVEGVTLLSGVNSGGKTSTLDLVATVAILAHMGLPVPAERARIERLDRLHYYAKSQGTLDAGAFESTLREFGDLVADEGPRQLVLVDELESITEPGASAKIIAGLLETLTERGATAVFVSHLAGEIRDAASIDLAVDGIRAEGLADGELVVDRSPVKDHLARSTPELIVEKLAGEHGEAFYERLLGKFRSD